MTGEGTTLDMENEGLGLTITPVSRNSPAVNITLGYYIGEIAENTTMACPEAPTQEWVTNAWDGYYLELHESEMTNDGYAVTSQIVGAGTFEGWIYHQYTTGPSGQAVVEETEIELRHTPR